MRCATPQPCWGPRLKVFRINRSRVPCSRSVVDWLIVLLSNVYKRGYGGSLPNVSGKGREVWAVSPRTSRDNHGQPRTHTDNHGPPGQCASVGSVSVRA